MSYLTAFVIKLERRYLFKTVEHCNMCNDPAGGHKVLGRRLDRSQGKNPRNKKGILTTVAKCTNCGLVYSNPQPIPNSIGDHYDVPPEEYWKETYFEIDPTYFKQEIDTLKSLNSFKPGDKALDIGAGLGKCMIALRNAGFEVKGIEPSESFYSRAIEKMNVSAEDLQLNSIESANFPEEHFDFITFGAVLEHLYDPSMSISKSMRWLKKGGIMHIEVPSSDWLINKLSNLFYRIQGLDYVANISPMHEPYHLYEFSLNSFRQNGQINDYEVLHHQYFVCPTYMPKVFDFFLIPFMKYTKTGMQLCVWLRKR